MTEDKTQTVTAFDGARRIASGTPVEVAPVIKSLLESTPQSQVLVFDDRTSQPVEFDLRGSVDDVLARLVPVEAPPPPRRPGRPKLGVVAREVTLLPRHWDWLASQPGGASVVLRRLVDEARRVNEPQERQRVAQEAAYRFIAAMAGDRPQFEEATRALFAGESARFASLTEAWPQDVRAHAMRLAAPAFAARAEGPA